jgi:zinc protease
MNRVLAVTLALALGACATVKNSPDILPPYGADKSLEAPQIAQRTLANGLTVWVVSRDGLPRVDAVLAVRGFTADDVKTPGRAGLIATRSRLPKRSRPSAGTCRRRRMPRR